MDRHAIRLDLEKIFGFGVVCLDWGRWRRDDLLMMHIEVRSCEIFRDFDEWSGKHIVVSLAQVMVTDQLQGTPSREIVFRLN